MTDALNERLSRRSILKAGVAGAAFLGAGGLGAGCGSSSSPTVTTAASKPKRGGRLRAGLTGGSSTDTVDAQMQVNFLDQARLIQLYDSPTAFDLNAHVQLSLAEELVPNADASAWTMRVRPDVTFHNGKTLTADDIIFSFQRILNPKAPRAGAPQIATLDVKNLQKLDSRTVRLPFTSPFSAFYQVLADYLFFMVPVGYDPKHPIGTGPFKFKSFTPGVESVFVRNENYWGGAPYIDELVITDYLDETSQVNGLLSSDLDAIDSLSAASISDLTSQGKVVVLSETGNFTPFTMRCDIPPFNDVRVRQAMKYLIDRQQMLDLVFGGHGSIGNDLFSVTDPNFDHNIPQREQDVQYAKSLLRQAGHSDLTLQLVTSAIAPGTELLATVFAQQAKAAGVTVNLQQLTPTAYYTNYLKWTFAQDNWSPLYFMTVVSEGQLATSPYNESHFNNPEFNRLYSHALASPTQASQRDYVYQMQQIYWDQGGWIIPYFTPFIDAHSPGLHGVVPSKNVPLSNFGFKNFWFT